LPVIGVSSPGNTAYFSSTSFTATGGQTTFTPSGSYTPGFINVIRNGSQLAPADYTATNGTTVVLNNACTAGDIVVIEVFTLTSISNALPLTGGTVTGDSTFNTGVNLAVSSGNVGVGVTPSAWDTTNSVKAIQNPAGAFWNYANNNVYLAEGYFFNGSNRIYSASSIGVAEYSMQNGTHIWASAASGTAGGTVSLTERARIDSSGNLLVNKTSGLGSAKFVVEADTTSANPMTVSNSRSTAATDYSILFYRNGSIVGSVQTALGGPTTYATTSDYRLKDNIQPMIGALAKVAQLKPVTYEWKLTGTNSQGFIAHELQEVIPEAVCGEKDAVEEDGSIKPQQIDTSFLVATLTAAIQEQQAMIEELKAKVAALEAK
jgi:hypothetical protein